LATHAVVIDSTRELRRGDGRPSLVSTLLPGAGGSAALLDLDAADATTSATITPTTASTPRADARPARLPGIWTPVKGYDLAPRSLLLERPKLT
jgi:hypothetical protein